MSALPNVNDSFTAVHATLDDVERRARAMRPVLAFSPLPGLRERVTKRRDQYRMMLLEESISPQPRYDETIKLTALISALNAVLLDIDLAEDRT